MSAHTPGPWHIATAITTEDTIGAIAVVRRSIFAVFSPAARGDADSDARLIAAAPDLLEALRFLLREEPNIYEGRLEASLYVTVDALEFARAAIAKAEGI